jgi:hypothetical protein
MRPEEQAKSPVLDLELFSKGLRAAKAQPSSLMLGTSCFKWFGLSKVSPFHFLEFTEVWMLTAGRQSPYNNITTVDLL